MVATVAVLALITVGLKGFGALVPRLPPAVAARLPALAPALLAALVATQLTDDRGLPRLDERAAGVLVAAVLVWRRAPFAVCIVAAAAVAAGLRALS